MNKKHISEKGVVVLLGILFLVGCGKQVNQVDAESATEGDSALYEEFANVELTATLRGATDPTASTGSRQQKFQEIIAKVKSFASQAKVGFQACKNDVKTKAPQLLESKPTSKEEAKAKLQAILNFLKTNTSVSAECKALITKLEGLRNQIASKRQSSGL